MSALLEAEEAYKVHDHARVLAKVADALKEDPDRYEPWILRGAVLLQKKDYYASILNNDKALNIEPNLFQALNNRAASYLALNMLDEATRDLNRSIELNSDAWQPHLQLGLMYGAIEQPEAAEYHLRKAAAMLNSNYVPHIALGTLLLGQGKWEEGFKEDNYRPEITKQPFPAPYWAGEDLNGKHILLFSEGGQGDRILTLRFINTVREAYPLAAITLKVPEKLIKLCQNSFPVTVTSETVETDYVCSLFNVPELFGMTWQTVPRPEKYLTPTPNPLWKDKLSSLPAGLNIGICWASNNGSGKVVPDQSIDELGAMPGINFICLQYPYRHTESRLKLVNWNDYLSEDWDSTAGLINSLDAVVSMDTAVAHLAGALGKPVYTWVRYSTYWPWMYAKLLPSPTYSIWYPSMKLLRGRLIGDWTAPTSQIILEMQRDILGLTKS